MATDSGRNFTDLISSLQKNSRFADLSWSGSFNDYLNLVRENPKVTRNAFQRMYDMIMAAGTSEYVDVKKQIVHYKFFDDEVNDGKDAVYGADIPLMKLVNVLRSAALGYGTEKRVILLHGPVGSAKSTICRQLKAGVERYSKSDEGAMYTFEWVDENGKHEDIFGKGVRVFPSPMNEEPLLVLPVEMRQAVYDELNRGSKGDFRVNVTGEMCPPSRWIFKALMEAYHGDITKVLQHVRVKRLVLSEADRVGIGTFQPKDEKNQDSTELTVI